MKLPADLKYTASHEWVRLEADGLVTVGITDYAQERLGDLVYVESPKPGTRVSKDKECGVVESVKAASDIYAPISGEIVAANSELDKSPEKVNQDAYAAWMFKIKPADAAELDTLLDAAAYRAAAEAEGH